MSNVYTQEAIVNIFREEGILAKEEVIEEIKWLRVDAEKKKM